MADFQFKCMAFLISIMALPWCYVRGNFLRSIYFNWGAQHSGFFGNGDDATLVLGQTSGSGIQSKEQFLFGSIEMLIKLIPGDSAGTVTAYYLSSVGEKHDEIDFEFLGNTSGQPYTIHTNIFIRGVGGREEQFHPWFDPTADYHNYTIHWNPSQVVWYVDNIPIRAFKNYGSDGISYPKKQAMRVYSSIWNADGWATVGGLVNTNWTKAPFIARLRHFRARACKYEGPRSITECVAPAAAAWWNSPLYSQLNVEKQNQLNWIRSNFMVYDYCKDIKRFNGFLPGECFKPQF